MEHSNPNNTTQKHWIDYATLSAVVCNIFMTFIGGWYFLFRYEAEFYHASKELAETQKNVQLLELNIAEAKQRMEMQKSQLLITDNALKILDNLRPKTELVTIKEVKWDDDNVEMEFIIKNTGQYLVHVKPTNFIVTTEMVKSIDHIPDNIILYKKYFNGEKSDIPAGTS